MKVGWVLAALTVFLVPLAARGEEGQAGGPELLARLDTTASSGRWLFLYCEQELRGVHVWLNNQWVAADAVPYVHQGKPYNVYRVSQRFYPAHGRKLSVNSWTPSGQKTFRHQLSITSSSEDFGIRATLQSTRTREQYLADKERIEKQRYSDPYGFIVLLNRYRALIGLGPVVHDGALSRDAQVNNSMGSPHAFMGGAMVQNWAFGFHNALGVLRGWQNSPGHNRNLLSPSITRVGIAHSNAEWTFNGR